MKIKQLKTKQLAMFEEGPQEPTLSDYDWILVNSSAGKDSQAMLDAVYEQSVAAGVESRIVVVHCDLGRVEWEGTRGLAETQAQHYGVRFEVVKRSQNDLLDHVAARGKWPSPQQRYCTSDHKRAPVHTLLTRLADETRSHRSRCAQVIPVRILNCMGLRADESPARAKKRPFAYDKAASNGRRTVETWLPIHDWTEAEVWERIRESGVPSHYAYALGMPRLSCCFCIFAPKAALTLAGKHNSALLDEYVKVEAAIGHKFRMDLSMADIKEAVRRGDSTEAVSTWKM